MLPQLLIDTPINNTVNITEYCVMVISVGGIHNFTNVHSNICVGHALVSLGFLTVFLRKRVTTICSWQICYHRPKQYCSIPRIGCHPCMKGSFIRCFVIESSNNNIWREWKPTFHKWFVQFCCNYIVTIIVSKLSIMKQNWFVDWLFLFCESSF